METRAHKQVTVAEEPENGRREVFCVPRFWTFGKELCGRKQWIQEEALLATWTSEARAAARAEASATRLA